MSESKKPNCKPENYACGLKCQPRKYKCPSEKVKEVAEAASKFVEAIATVSVEQTSQKINENLQKLFNIYDGTEEEISTEIIDRVYPVKISEDKFNQAIETLRNTSLNEDEVMAILRWVEFLRQSFEPINKVLFFDESSKDDLISSIGQKAVEYGENTGIHLARALKKLQESEFEYSKERVENDERYLDSKIRPDGKITRSVRVHQFGLSKFLEPYEEALKNKTIFRERCFGAATANAALFDDKALVEIEYEPLNEGSSAIMLEAIKKSSEGEIMFPPGSKFKVLEIREKKVEDFIPKISLRAKKFGIQQPNSVEEVKSLISFLKSELDKRNEDGEDGEELKKYMTFHSFLGYLENFIESLKYNLPIQYKIILKEIA